MQIEVSDTLVLVIGLECGLIGVQRYLGIDHQLLLARNVDHRVGPQAAFVGFDRMLQIEIGMFRQAALLQHVLQCSLAPAPPRLGGIGQGIAEPLRLAPYFLLSALHFGDLLVKPSECIGALFLQRRDLFFIGFQPLAHRVEQCAQFFLAGLFRMAKPLVRPLEEGFLCLRQYGRAGVLEFLEQFFARFDQQPFLLVEIGGLLLQRRELGAQFAIAAPQIVERRLMVPAHIAQFGVERIGPPCPHGRIFQIDDRLAKLLFGLARFRIALPMARLPFGHGPRSQKPSQARSCEQRHDCNDCHFHGCRLGGTHAEHQPFPTAIPDAMFASGPSIPKARPRARFSRTKRCQRMYFINQPSKKATRYRESPLRNP